MSQRQYSLPSYNRFGEKDYSIVTRYFLIRDADKENNVSKSVIPIGHSQGLEMGFSFVMLNGVNHTGKDMRRFIINRCRKGYKIIDSENVVLDPKELFAFASHSRHHTGGNYNCKFRDHEGYSFMERIIKPKKENNDRRN